jgi:hypothetical protein
MSSVISNTATVGASGCRSCVRQIMSSVQCWLCASTCPFELRRLVLCFSSYPTCPYHVIILSQFVLYLCLSMVYLSKYKSHSFSNWICHRGSGESFRQTYMPSGTLEVWRFQIIYSKQSAIFYRSSKV